MVGLYKAGFWRILAVFGGFALTRGGFLGDFWF